MHEIGGTLFHRWYVTIFGLAFLWFAVRQLGWIFTKGREGGFFIMNGRKRELGRRPDARTAAIR